MFARKAVTESLRLKTELWGKLCLDLYSEIHGVYIHFCSEPYGTRVGKT